MFGRRVGRTPQLGPSVGELQRLGQRVALGFDQMPVGVRGAPHGLRRVVDQDVQRPLGGHPVRQRDHLGRVAQVDADNAQPVQPVGRVLKGREPAGGVPGETGGDGGVRAIAQQPQGDMHADLGPPAGEQRAFAVQVGPGLAAFAPGRGAVRAQVVVEGVHGGVALLADIAASGALVAACGVLLGGCRQVQPQGFVIQPGWRAGGGALDHGPVRSGDRRPFLGFAVPFGGLEHVRRGAAHGDMPFVGGF